MKQRRVITVISALAVAILLLGVAVSAGYAKSGRERYIEASERLVLCDLSDALSELEAGVSAENAVAVNRAAGRAEAYFSRCSFEGCEGIYAMIDEICENASLGVFESGTANELSNAAKLALEGDGGAKFREFSKSREKDEMPADLSGEEDDSYRMLEKIGRSDNDIALKRATSFACRNAAFEKCECPSAFPPCFKYSGENIFICLASDGRRVLMYCFDRDGLEGYSISEETASRNAERIIFKEKIKLSSNVKREACLDGGVYRFDYKTDLNGTDINLVSIEIYSDTGSLRKYDACNYYKLG